MLYAYGYLTSRRLSDETRVSATAVLVPMPSVLRTAVKPAGRPLEAMSSPNLREILRRSHRKPPTRPRGCQPLTYSTNWHVRLRATLRIVLGLGRVFRWIFLMAQAGQVILGTPRKHSLLVERKPLPNPSCSGQATLARDKRNQTPPRRRTPTSRLCSVLFSLKDKARYSQLHWLPVQTVFILQVSLKSTFSNGPFCPKCTLRPRLPKAVFSGLCYNLGYMVRK